MPYNPEKHHRRSIRLKGYDYSQPGIYFVTLCIHRRECLLGEVIEGVMQLSSAGRIVEKEWLRNALVHRNVELDAFVIMPNHLHGLVILTDNPKAVPSGGDLPGNLNSIKGYVQTSRPKGPVSGSLGAIIGQFKSLSGKQINRIRKSPGVSVWQRDFHDHIIRHEVALENIRKYIVKNPQRWANDPTNPQYQVSNEHPLTDLPF
jgi:putative transposase